ncbi:MAG: response regulator [Alphaproteobacteria bacterium]
MANADRPGPALLLVDDDSDTLDELLDFFENRGVRAHGASNVDGAIELLSLNTYIDVVITDIRMPDRPGQHLLAEIASLRRERGRAVVAIVMTGHAGQAEANESDALGAAAFLTKPVSPRRLIKEVIKARQCLAGGAGDRP